VKFLLRRGDGLAGGIENDRAGTGGPLIDGEQVPALFWSMLQSSQRIDKNATVKSGIKKGPENRPSNDE